MKTIIDIITGVFTDNSFVMAFLVVGIVSLFANFVSSKITKGRIHSSAIAIFIALILAYVGGCLTDGKKGLADIGMFAGIGVSSGAAV